MKTLMMGGAVAALLMGSAANASTSSTKYSGHELAKQATITLDEARAAALKARLGRIVNQELEREGGGSGLRYSFDVVSKGKTIEVGIDAMTGNVLENGAESATKENKEKAEEAKVKH